MSENKALEMRQAKIESLMMKTSASHWLTIGSREEEDDFIADVFEAGFNAVGCELLKLRNLQSKDTYRIQYEALEDLKKDQSGLV